MYLIKWKMPAAEQRTERMEMVWGVWKHNLLNGLVICEWCLFIIWNPSVIQKKGSPLNQIVYKWPHEYNDKTDPKICKTRCWAKNKNFFPSCCWFDALIYVFVLYLAFVIVSSFRQSHSVSCVPYTYMADVVRSDWLVGCMFPWKKKRKKYENESTK